ncbi:acylphosphatase [Myxosarcina sp. GI1]|uniref:acylphosphatase n=1 Tax=Myxosarcina sp. GI1 TaxID=1541065 RepID=UPI00055B1E82|nr:acylphosphatase [Myxosarcina sp. GI1]
MKKVRAIVSGRVQGVGFRMSTQSKAKQIGVAGYVRNLASGEVEIVAAGEAEPVNELLTWAEMGPPSAVVNDLQVECLADDEEFKGFEIRR